jgi:cytochrome c oxidase subunit II
MTMRSILLSLFAAILLSSSVVPAIASPPDRVEVTAKRFAFTPDHLTLKRGQPVVIVFKSADVAHGLRFRGLNLNIKAAKGQTTEVPFTPEKAGDFTGECSVFCGSGHGRMKLVLHVTE